MTRTNICKNLPLDENNSYYRGTKICLCLEQEAESRGRGVVFEKLKIRM